MTSPAGRVLMVDDRPDLLALEAVPEPLGAELVRPNAVRPTVVPVEVSDDSGVLPCRGGGRTVWCDMARPGAGAR